MSHEIDQLELQKISISLRVIADFHVKNLFFAECNFHINVLKVSGCNQFILSTFKTKKLG